MKAMLILVLAFLVVSCAEPSLHLQGFRNSLQNLDQSYASQAGNSGASLLDSKPIRGMEDASTAEVNSWKYLAFQSEMYRGMDKGDKPSWYRKAAREEVESFKYAPQDVRQFVLQRTEEATRQRP